MILLVDITTDDYDYKSCLKALHLYLTKEKIATFEVMLNEEHADYADNSIFNFWKHCKLNAAQQNNSKHVINLQEADLENIIYTESILNDLPVEIDGVLFPATHEDDVISEFETANNKWNIELEKGQDNYYCKQLLEIILENVFNNVENVQNICKTPPITSIDQQKRIRVISNILISTKVMKILKTSGIRIYIGLNQKKKDAILLVH